MVLKIVAGTAAALVALVLTGGSAFAFHCFNDSRSENGNEHAANGALMSVEEALIFFGLCPDGVEHVLEGLDDEGFDTSMLINFNALMAGGLEKNGKGEEKLHDGRGIDHLSEEFLETADALIEEGFGLFED